jgi:hypothetical protein
VTTRQKAAIYAVPVVALISVLITLILMHSAREPYYEGKPFTYWLDQIVCTQVFTNGSFSVMYPGSYLTFAQAEKDQANLFRRTEKAIKVVTEMGGECLPLLMRRLRSHDSKWKNHVIDWAERFHLMRPSWRRSVAFERGQALTAITKLGYSAKPIFQELKILANDKDPSVSAAAKYALEQLRPDDFERLENAMKKPGNPAAQ